MSVPSLKHTPLVRSLGMMQKSLDDLNAKFPGTARGTQRATIRDVDDPEERGRVRVVFDAHNPEAIAQYIGAGIYSQPRDGEEQLSHWIDVSPAFKGKQPQGLLNKRVSIVLSNGQHPYAILQDVIYDPQILTDSTARELEMPNNSSMTRLPCYESGSLPPASKENVGCMVVECGGPLQSDWLCVCLQRNGSYYWVRHIDASHGHAGQNDSGQGTDSDGDSQQPVINQTVWDYTFPTTAGEMSKISADGTQPRPNPFGSEATYIGAAS